MILINYKRRGGEYKWQQRLCWDKVEADEFWRENARHTTMSFRVINNKLALRQFCIDKSTVKFLKDEDA